MSRAYYNEREPYAAQWLRNLIAAELICPGDVDDRDIRDVTPADIAGYTQCHFFAGIGVWSRALRLAGWPDGRPVWTGSCPCQPFSAAGRGAGFADERHVWPHWFHLIRVLRPSEVFGEQVASDDGLSWLDLVCAAGYGAPHIRQRLFFVADAVGERIRGRRPDSPGSASGRMSHQGAERERLRSQLGPSGNAVAVLVGDTRASGLPNGEPTIIRGAGWRVEGRAASEPSLSPCGVADPDGRHASSEGLQRSGEHRQQPADCRLADGDHRPGPTNGFWRDADWLRCRDGRWRPVEPGSFPLAHGAASRVGRLRAYGNAISPYPAAHFVEAFLHHKSTTRG